MHEVLVWGVAVDECPAGLVTAEMTHPGVHRRPMRFDMLKGIPHHACVAPGVQSLHTQRLQCGPFSLMLSFGCSRVNTWL